jgi:hypothetical protein
VIIKRKLSTKALWNTLRRIRRKLKRKVKLIAGGQMSKSKIHPEHIAILRGMGIRYDERFYDGENITYVDDREGKEYRLELGEGDEEYGRYIGLWLDESMDAIYTPNDYKDSYLKSRILLWNLRFVRGIYKMDKLELLKNKL